MISFGTMYRLEIQYDENQQNLAKLLSISCYIYMYSIDTLPYFKNSSLEKEKLFKVIQRKS